MAAGSTVKIHESGISWVDQLDDFGTFSHFKISDQFRWETVALSLILVGSMVPRYGRKEIPFRCQPGSADNCGNPIYPKSPYIGGITGYYWYKTYNLAK